MEKFILSKRNIKEVSKRIHKSLKNDSWSMITFCGVSFSQVMSALTANNFKADQQNAYTSIYFEPHDHVNDNFLGTLRCNYPFVQPIFILVTVGYVSRMFFMHTQDIVYIDESKVVIYSEKDKTHQVITKPLNLDGIAQTASLLWMKSLVDKINQ